MAIPIISAIAKLATLILLLIISAGVLHSSASRVVVSPQYSSEKNTVDDDHVRNKESLPLVPKRGTGVVMITARAETAAAAASSINGTSYSVQNDCDDVCNDHNCDFHYPTLCQPGDRSRCYVGCHCADKLCHCICSR